jgi:hypothetical protein
MPIVLDLAAVSEPSHACAANMIWLKEPGNSPYGAPPAASSELKLQVSVECGVSMPTSQRHVSYALSGVACCRENT